MCIKNVSTAVRAAISAVLLAGAALPAIVLANPADDPAVVGREGQAFGKTLSDTFQFPTEGAGGTLNLGNGESINPNDMAPGGEGLYIQAPNVGGLQGIFDSDESMHDVGRGAQNQLWQDAQAKGNPFDPDPAMRDQPGPSTVSGAVYQIITGVSGARAQVPDLANDPIVNGADAHMLNPDMLESFGDCSIQSEVIETSRPVHVPDIEFCERIMAPSPSNCQVKHEVIIDRKTVQSTGSASRAGSAYCRTYNGHNQVMFGTALQPSSRYGGFDAASVSIPGTQDACKGGTLKYTVESVEYISAGVGDITSYCEVSSSIPGGNKYFYPTLSSVSCKNGLITLSLLSSEFVGLNKITLSYETTVEELFVKEDKWYPQECIDIANSSSG